jgi:hypothetical protein
MWRRRLDFLLNEEAMAVDPAQKFKLREEVKEAKAKIAEWAPPLLTVTPRPSPSRLPHGATELFGREEDLAWLDRAWNDGVANVVTIVAWGGVGKTSLVAEWRNRLLAEQRVTAWLFDWSFYSQGLRDRGAVSADNFLREALRYFGDPTLADSAASSWDKGTRLAKLVSERQALLILDGLEPLQYPEGAAGSPGALKEGSIEALLKCLAMSSQGLCVVTTRIPVAELERFGPTLAPRRDLEKLSVQAGSDFLRSLLEPRNGKAVKSTQDERKEISREVNGHALTLQLLGVYIRRALGDVRRWREIDFVRANEEQGGHAFRVMAAYVTWLSGASIRGRRQLAVLRLLGLFDRPADPGCIEALRQYPAIMGVTEALVELDVQGWKSLISSLEELRLVTQSDYEASSVSGYDEAAARQAGNERRPSGEPTEQRPREFGYQAQVLDAHPLVREFFARELRKTSEEGWRDGHRRLYEHLCESVPYWPEDVVGMQPLYQAVVHGCAAGRIEEVCTEVYWGRIRRGDRSYSSKQLGSIGADLAAIACFFERTWGQPSTELGEADKAWVLSVAAFHLCALGRLSEALEPIRASLEMYVRREDWTKAAIVAGNLSELELTLGQTNAAVRDAARSVEHADRSTDDFQRMVTRTTHADARHQAGDYAGARELFEQAQAMQAQRQPTESRLYSLQGFQFCDLLLNSAERAAWRGALSNATHKGEHETLCHEVFARATQTLALARRGLSLLAIALDHLTLGRAALYAATLQSQIADGTTRDPALSFATAREHLNAAVDGLRKAGHLDYLPRGLITRAWLHYRERPDLARADLDEAWALAERGPMPLHQADIQLMRARLFSDRSALVHARELITRHGYGRRFEELADADLRMR